MPITRPTMVDDDGTDTTGTSINKAFMDAFMDDIDAVLGAIDDEGALSLAASSALTIASGAVTITAGNNVFTIDTEGAASTDDLDTITLDTNGRECRLLILAPEAAGASPARVPTIKDGTGNISLNGGDFAMNDAKHRLLLYRDGSTWCEIARSASGGLRTPQRTSVTGAQANFSLTDNHTWLLCSGAAPVFSGFTVAGSTPSDGASVLIEYTGTGSCRVEDESTGTGSTATNRVQCESVRGQIVGAKGAMLLTYDGTAGRWQLALLTPGAPVALSYAALTFSGSGTLTWTVASGDLSTAVYVQRGRSVQYLFRVITTSVSGTGAYLQIDEGGNLPGGFSGAYPICGVNPCRALDDGTGVTAVMYADNSSIIQCGKVDLSAWAAATNTTEVTGSVTALVL